MYRVASVKVVEAFCDVQQLSRAFRMIGRGCGEMTHKGNPIRAGIFRDVMCQNAVGHPLGNDLQRFDSNTKEGHNVGVPQSLPHDRLFEK